MVKVEKAVKNCLMFSISSLFPRLVFKVIYLCIEMVSRLTVIEVRLNFGPISHTPITRCMQKYENLPN